MHLDPQQLWKRYRKHSVRVANVGLTLDISRMPFPQGFFKQWEEPFAKAFDAMDRLEAGAIANPDEGRMVGHYWLRNPSLAPSDELRQDIQRDLDKIKRFAADVHAKKITPPKSARFTEVLVCGIGGSALGPQLVADCLGAKRDKLNIHFLDNTDPEGMQRVLTSMKTRLKSTLVLIVSKSGGTPETRNAMLMTQQAFKDNGLDFAKQAVAITGDGSKLDQLASKEGWLERFMMHDWVGGRTSVMSAVGLLPAALQGVKIDAFLDGAAKMDAATRQHSLKKNPAAKLAAMWHFATDGTGEKDMVVLPYRDRLVLLSRYLQQLVMESLGKKEDRDGNVVHQGIAVYGNKGSTDQHAYVQQLRDGVNNFFATFITVLQDVPRPGSHEYLQVEPDVTPGDYLEGFYLGTRKALYEADRGSITITLDKLDPKSLGALIALFERAVGLYAELVNINAYHQPGVEAGKKAAAEVLDVQRELVDHLRANPDAELTPEELAAAIGQPEAVETVYHVAEHLAANKRLITKQRSRYAAR